jgi:type IV pilus assembly protein PilP
MRQFITIVLILVIACNAQATRRIESLQEFELSALRYIDFQKRGPARLGVVLAPDGKRHKVRIGNYMGQNDGRISNITPKSIQLVEVYPDKEGNWYERNVEILLTPDR